MNNLRTNVEGLEAAWIAVEGELPEDFDGPFIDKNYMGFWVAEAYPPVDPYFGSQDAIEGIGQTPTEALMALAAALKKELVA